MSHIFIQDPLALIVVAELLMAVLYVTVITKDQVDLVVVLHLLMVLFVTVMDLMLASSQNFIPAVNVWQPKIIEYVIE